MNHYDSNDSAKERRLTLRLLGYWERLRRGRLMPTENDINPEDIDDLWDYCFLVQVRDMTKEDYNYTYLGNAIVEAYRAGLSEDEPAGMISPAAGKMAPNYAKILETKQPIMQEGEFANLRGQTVKFRQCLLPLGHDDVVDAIFGGMRFKIFDK